MGETPDEPDASVEAADVAPAEEPPVATETETPAEEPQDAPTDEPTEEPVSKAPDWSLDVDEDYAAYQALRKAQWPHDLIVQLDRQALRMRGAAAGKMFADIDRKLSTKAPTTETDGKGTGEPEQGRTPAAPSAVAQSVRTIAETLGLEGDEAESVTTALSAAIQEAIRPYAEKLERYEVQSEAATKAQVVAELGNDIPRLKAEPEFLNRVYGLAKTLDAEGLHQELTGKDRALALIRSASVAIDASSVTSKSESIRKKKVEHWTNHGSPNSTAAKKKPAPPQNELDRIMGVIDAVDGDVPMEEIMATYGGRPK